MAVVDPAVLRAMRADLGRARQEELPLDTVERKGPSYIPSRYDESLHYDPKVKQALGNKWSSSIHDEESEQMRGLANLDARPWASTGPSTPSIFNMPKPQPKSAPTPAPAPVQAPAPKPAPASHKTPSSSAAPVKGVVSRPSPAAQTAASQRQNHMLDHGSCQVSLNEGHTVVPDARYCVAVSVQNDVALFMLTAPGKPSMCHNVLDLEPPVMHGTSCIVKTKPGKDIQQAYSIKPAMPSTADKLAKVLGTIQIALQKESLKSQPPIRPKISLPLAPKPASSVPATATATRTPERSLIFDKTPESTPDNSPVLTQRELVEITVKKQKEKATVKLADVIDNITVIVRSAYYQMTGLSAPMSPRSASGEVPGDLALAEWLTKGHIDSESDETKRGLVEILRFLTSLRLKASVPKEPMMTTETMELLKGLETPIKSSTAAAGTGTVNYSVSELLKLKPAAVAPAGAKRKGLAGSVWAK